MDANELQKVKDAFELLIDHVAKMTDGEYAQVIYWAAEDVISILDGTWANEVATLVAPVEDDTAADWKPF